MSDFSNSRILITGVSSGLGYGFARRLLEAGARVLALGRNAPADLTAEFADRFAFVACDLGNFDAVAPALGALPGPTEPLDLVILNAGVLGEFADLRDTDMGEIRRIMDVNLWANKILVDALFASDREIREVWGISSGASVNGSRGWNAYSLSKAGLNMLIKLYAAELPETHWVSIAPGLIDTAMQEFISAQNEATVRKFPALERLRSARGTPAMPGPLDAAAKILGEREKLRAVDNGSFVDVRKL